MLYFVYVEFQRDVLKIKGNEITIGVKSKPQRGQANNEIVKKLAAHFGVSTDSVIIRAGHKTRKKMIEILS